MRNFDIRYEPFSGLAEFLMKETNPCEITSNAWNITSFSWTDFLVASSISIAYRSCSKQKISLLYLKSFFLSFFQIWCDANFDGILLEWILCLCSKKKQIDEKEAGRIAQQNFLEKFGGRLASPRTERMDIY